MELNLKQTLLENAISSLREGLTKYTNTVSLSDEETNQYKFAILHFTHFIELSLKYYIPSIHPLLIYKNPFDKRLADPKSFYEVQTISLDQSVQFLKNNGVANIPHDFENDLKFLKMIRNQIMHSTFTLNSEEIDIKLGRLAKAFVELDKKVLDIELASWLSDEEYTVFEKLHTNYIWRDIVFSSVVTCLNPLIAKADYPQFTTLIAQTSFDFIQGVSDLL